MTTNHGNRRHAIGKIGWLMFGWGVVFIGLGLIGHENINPMASVQGAVIFCADIWRYRINVLWRRNKSHDGITVNNKPYTFFY